jgi:hypothetical protein
MSIFPLKMCGFALKMCGFSLAKMALIQVPLKQQCQSFAEFENVLGKEKQSKTAT